MVSERREGVKLNIKQGMYVSRYDRKSRLLRLVSEMKNKGIVIDFASDPCFLKINK